MATTAVIRSLDLEYPSSSSNGFPLVCVNGSKGVKVIKNKDSKGARPQNHLPVDESYTMTQLFHDPVPKDLTLKTLALARKMNCVVNYYIDHDIYAQPITDSHYKATKGYSVLTGVTYSYCTDAYEEAMKRGLPSKLLILCEEKDIDLTYNQVCDELGDNATVIRGSPPFFVEILQKDICKGKGLEKMCAKLGVGLDQCISFGDGDNDIEFLQAAGLGIAMKNGRDSVKAIADKVTEWSNVEDGVIRTLKVMEAEGLLHFPSA